MSSQLIQMRQRIRSIETIKKITHAMRLISMSLHARLKSKEDPVAAYKNGINSLFYTLKNQTPLWNDSLISPPAHSPSKPLIIVIGSNKGLCGNFNTALFKTVEAHLPKQGEIHYIAIGRKAVEQCKKQAFGVPVATYGAVSLMNVSALASQLAAEIMNPDKQYTSVIVFSNVLKNFFIQRPKISTLIPFAPDEQMRSTAKKTEFVWEQKPEEVLDYLMSAYLEANIHFVLFESLLAEQAARFLSMDNATRNAKNILDETRLQYNKLRQAKITKELTELTGSF